VELAEKLNENQINIDLLVTIDLQAGTELNNNTVLPDNVSAAKNYYQTNTSFKGSPVSWGKYDSRFQAINNPNQLINTYENVQQAF
jgi:hypothetical protein